MTRQIALFIAIIALMASLVASAQAQSGASNEAEGPKLKLKPNAKGRILTHALLSPVYFISTVTIHEGSHALAAKIVGDEVVSFKPYPNRVSNDNSSRMVGGSIAYGHRDRTPEERFFISAAPTVTAITLFVATDLALTYAVDRDSVLAPILLAGGMLWPTFGLILNFANFRNFSANWSDYPVQYDDTSRLAKLTGTPRWSWTVPGNAIAAVGIWRVLHQGREMFYETDNSAKSRVDMAIVPVFNGSIGFTAIGHF